MNIADIVSLTAPAVILWPVWKIIDTKNDWYAQLVLTLIGGLVLLEQVIKPFFGTRGLFGRPVGAMNCGLFCGGGLAGGHPGFPSGHMTTVTFLVLTLAPASPLGYVWILAMAWARLAKKCHNLFQIGGGILYGAVLATLFTYFRPL